MGGTGYKFLYSVHTQNSEAVLVPRLLAGVGDVLESDIVEIHRSRRKKQRQLHCLQPGKQEIMYLMRTHQVSND
jgi:hypothetical protein